MFKFQAIMFRVKFTVALTLAVAWTATVLFLNKDMSRPVRLEYKGRHWLSNATPIKYYSDTIVFRYQHQHPARHIAHHAATA